MAHRADMDEGAVEHVANEHYSMFHRSGSRHLAVMHDG